MKKLELAWEIAKDLPMAAFEGMLISSIPLAVVSAAAGGISFLLKEPEIGRYLEIGACSEVLLFIAGGFAYAMNGKIPEGAYAKDISRLIKQYREEKNSKTA